jgi:hypothetical protein
MIRRTVLLAISCVLALSLGVTSAVAWCNGPAPLATPRLAGFGYGTHDWILDHAINQAGTEGDWVDVKTALWHTNDPDYYDINRDLHLFRDTGLSRGGPQAVADQYYIAAEALRRGDKATASKALGVLSHYYTDCMQPYHTTYDAMKYNGAHSYYERAVDKYNRHYGEGTFWLSGAPAQPVTDVRQRAVYASKFSRARYAKLRSALQHDPDASVRKNSTVNDVTGDILSRGVNDLADIIRTLSAVHNEAQGLASAISTTPALGTSAPPARISTYMSNPKPHRGRKVCAYAKCYDAKGQIIEGARVYFYWPKAGGSTFKVAAYTNQFGVAHSWRPTSGLAIRKHRVKAVSNSSGASRTSSVLFRVQR